MSFSLWLRNRTRTRPPRGRAQHRPAAPRFRPRLEALEGRWLPSTLTVMNNLDSGPGSLRADIAAANSGDKIVFAPGLNGQTITLTSGELFISKGLTIQGPGASHLTISGDHLSRVFEVNANQPVALTGLTISNGIASIGGAILNNTTLTVSGCTIFNNVAPGFGGGIYNSGMLTVSNSTLSRNHASYGGGIDNRGTLTVSGSTLSFNSGSQAGGGIDDGWGRTATLTNCTLYYNIAQFGGALFIDWSATATLINCTLSRNFAGLGGGIDNGFDNNNQGVSGSLNLINTIVAGNYASPNSLEPTGQDILGRVNTADHNLIGDGNGSSNGNGGLGISNGVNGNIVGGENGHPLIFADLGPLLNNGGPTQTMALLPGSPAIGHADNTQAPATDQRGVTRLDKASETTDIGAFELTGTGSASATTFSLAPVGTAPSARIPVNTVPAAEVASGNVANPDAQAGRVPLQNGDSAVRRTWDVVVRITRRTSDHQKIAAVDELFAWNTGSDVFGAF